MKYKISILVALIFSLNGMDAPQASSSTQTQQTIPEELTIKYNEEKDRFIRYKLNDPEAKFLPLLRTQLKKDEKNLFPYLGSLNIFSNLLLAQHFLLNKAANIHYLTQKRAEYRAQERSFIPQMGGIINPSNPGQALLKFPDMRILNELLTHDSIAKKVNEVFTPEELQIIFNWSFDDSFDPWMKLYSQQRLLLNIVIPIQNMRFAELNAFDKQLNQIWTNLNNNFLTLPQIIQKNVQEIPRLYESNQMAFKRFENYQKQSVKLQTTLDSLVENNFNTIASAGHLYSYTHSWYEQLYKIVRAEMKAVITQLMKLHPDRIVDITKLATNSFGNVLPDKVLPAELPPFQDPAQTIAIPNLGKERAAAKKIWDEQQLQKEEERKKNNKIKQTADGSSYVLEYQDTPISITIHNEKNNTQEIIFKHEHPFEVDKAGKNIFPIKYTDWVKQWFNTPQEAIATQGYTDRTSKKFTLEQDRWKPIVMHGFSPLVDDYIKQWGRITTTKNRRNLAQEDILITIPGKMIYPPDSKPQEEAGIFAYIIDSKTGDWYHRMFTPGSLSELTKNLFEKGYFTPEMTGYYDVFFPALPARKK